MTIVTLPEGIIEEHNRVLKLILPEDIKLILPEDIVVTTTITLPEGIMALLLGGGLVIKIVKKRVSRTTR